MMRVVHLSYYYGCDVGGASAAALRLHRALLRAGVDSHFICVSKREDGENVHQLPRPRLLAILNYFVVRVMWVVSRLIFGRILMPNLIPLLGFDGMIRGLKPDVVHVHFVWQDMLSFRQLERMGVPMIVTLHDFLLLNAVDDHPRGDRRFEEGFDEFNSRWFERWMFARKCRLWALLRPVVIGPSTWSCRVFSRSFIGKGMQPVAILNVMDPVFAFSASERRPHDDFIVLFGARGGRAAEHKGWSDLMDALTILPDGVKSRLSVHVFGEVADDRLQNGIRIHFLGMLESPQRVRDAHNAADILAFPSRQETLGMVKIEALLDGLPVVSFNRTACAEGIVHGENGWVASDGDVVGYAAGIEYYFRKWERGELECMRSDIAKTAKELFDEVKIVEQTVSVYRGAIKGC